MKNALDWLHVLGKRDPPYLHDKVIGLISAAGGTQGLQAINTMEFAVRALRGWAVAYVVPVASAARVFDTEGRIHDKAIELQLKTLGSEVVRVAERFAADHSLHRQAECDHAAEQVAAVGSAAPEARPVVTSDDYRWEQSAVPGGLRGRRFEPTSSISLTPHARVAWRGGLPSARRSRCCVWRIKVVDWSRPVLFVAFGLPMSFPPSRRPKEDEVNAKEVR